MKKASGVRQQRENSAKSERQPHRVRLPGFLIEQEIGLGDVIKRATSAMGIRPCAGCQRRAATMNRWMTFSR
jgi:hypothetical protein